ncbi:MAG: HAD-IC family P-type ATPase, partial [Thiovulaceae bacterium]|nr:HAD-IC family P-type ATPase [Sulfurimonadaceae bacterium]
LSTLQQRDLPLGDQVNMAFKGTQVSYGRGVGVVVATGMQTQLGQIALLLSQEKAVKTPLQRRLELFGRKLAFAILAIATVIFVVGLLRGEALIPMFLTAVSLAVAAIPEALPAVVTMSLAFGARKMSQRKALVRRLPAVETLGSITYICSDKTGTLTENKMHLESLWVNHQIYNNLPTSNGTTSINLLGQALALNNDSELSDDQTLLGDPTEVALHLGAQSSGFYRNDLKEVYPRVAEIPFDSTRKLMSTLHQDDEGIIVFVKGAPEMLLENCHDQLINDQIQAFDAKAVLSQSDDFASLGYRVLAFAYKRLKDLPSSVESKTVERDLTFLGLVALIDPPRKEVPDAVRSCCDAGITPVMITGDHPQTALAIAHRIGIASKEARVITGVELAKMNDQKLATVVRDISVYARVSPQQKIRIVKALQQQGEYVSMTGDGVNDAPSLKSADIGIAMGEKGTDVARKAADLVLLDDNFATIVKAIREGRRIFTNIRKFIKYTMTSNTGEILTLFLAPFLGLPIPLIPIQILWINLVTDGLPGLALSAEPEERSIMKQPPRPPGESIFAQGMWQHMLWAG